MRIACLGKLFIIPEVIFANKCYCFILVWFQNGFIRPRSTGFINGFIDYGIQWWLLNGFTIRLHNGYTIR